MDEPAPYPIDVTPIGIVHSRFMVPVDMPIQTVAAPQETGHIQIFPQFEAGLRDIEGFEFLWLITLFHLVEREKLEVIPFLDTVSHGVFSTRAPARPNRLGLSLVRMTSREGNVIHFFGNDMVDGTPLLDIKPYIPKFDVRQTDRIGWFGEKLQGLETTRSDDRMAS